MPNRPPNLFKIAVFPALSNPITIIFCADFSVTISSASVKFVIIELIMIALFNAFTNSGFSALIVATLLLNSSCSSVNSRGFFVVPKIFKLLKGFSLFNLETSSILDIFRRSFKILASSLDINLNEFNESFLVSSIVFNFPSLATLVSKNLENMLIILEISADILLFLLVSNYYLESV